MSTVAAECDHASHFGPRFPDRHARGQEFCEAFAHLDAGVASVVMTAARGASRTITQRSARSAEVFFRTGRGGSTRPVAGYGHGLASGAAPALRVGVTTWTHG